MLKRHLLYIVTGANRGFGKAIVETIARHTKYRTTLVLVGRDSQSLHVNTSSSLVHSYVIGNVSLESAVGVEQTIIQPLTQLLKEWEENDAPPITKAILINNAGSTGDLSKKVGEYQAEDIQHYVQLNITSYITLINGFIQLLTEKTMASLQIVNISSLLAVEAFPHWGLYATAKAGRDMLLKVIAKEQDIRTLSYAPGPLDNEMQSMVRSTLGDPEQQKLYTDMANQVTQGRWIHSLYMTHHFLSLSFSIMFRVNWLRWKIQLPSCMIY